MESVQVFGHRGACGYRPENTIESFELAYLQGVVAIECDLVPTKDGQLVIRHENLLSHTSNVAEHPEFASRRRDEVYPWFTATDWFIQDFTVDELKTLRMRERLPELRPGSAKFDGQFQIATLDELLASTFLDGKSVILEVKHGQHFMDLGFDIPAMMALAIEGSNWRARGIRIIIESFNAKVLRALKAACGLEHEYVFLVEGWGMPTIQPINDFLAECAKSFDGVSFDFQLIFADENLVKLSHANGLKVFGWTSKVEDAENSIEEYFHHLVETGVDGIFADQPDLLHRYVTGLA